MADSKARGLLSVNPPNQISKDLPISDSSIPLSPQWLLPKPGESKAGMAAGEHHPSPYLGFNFQSDVVRLPANSDEVHGVQKKKDVFRSSLHCKESGRHDRWRDEERNIHSSIGKDLWREEDEELDNYKKIDRWTDATAGKHFEEACRPPSEHWNDLSRETGCEQRRESKWSTRWGPDNKEVSKWIDSGKSGDMSNVKGLSHLVNHGKDEREGDRPWRSNFCKGRGKVELPNNFLPVSSKEGHTFGHGQGHSHDKSHTTFMQDRGRFGYGANNVNHVLTDSRAFGFASENDNIDHGISAPFKYSRKNLLDLFRVTDTQLVHLLGGFKQVPSLTLEEALGPLAFCPPISEEVAMINEIEKGDIVSSGAPQISKEGSAGLGSADTMLQKRLKPGVCESLHAVVTSAELLRGAGSNLSVGSPQEKQLLNHWSISKLDPVGILGKCADDKRHDEGMRGDGGSFASFDDVLGNRNSDSDGKVLSQAGAAWCSSLAGLTNDLSHNQLDAATNSHANNTDMGWLQLRINHPVEREHGLSNLSMPQSELKWTTGEDPAIWQQVSGTIAREQEPRRHLLISPSPADLILYYKDPQGAVQGPFSGSDIIGWFEAGYFDINLPVRLANAPPDIPFSLLGDIMPHLKTKYAPPGFGVPKANEILDMPSMPAASNQGKVLTGPSGNLIREGQPHPHGASIEAANRFFESLMANKSHPLVRFPSSKGHSTGGVRPVGMGSGDSFDLLAQQHALERQRYLLSGYPQWPAGGTSPALLNSQLLPDPSMSHPKAFHSVLTEPSPQSSHPHNVDMMSILGGMPDRPLVNLNDGAGGWSSFSVHGGFNHIKQPHGQNFLPQAAFELRQPRMTYQNYPSAPNQLGQGMDNPNVLTADELLSTALPQDPQVINLLQQQYLLQTRSQAPSPSQQLSLLDKILLLKQQQQQEEQLRRQQQLLSQVLTDQNRMHSGASFGQLHAAAASTISTENVASDQLWHNLPSQMLDSGQKVLSTVHDDGIPHSTNMPLYAAQNVGFTAVSATAMHMEHHVGTTQMSCTKVTSKGEDADLNDAYVESRTTLSLPVSVDVEKAKDNSGYSSTKQFPLVNLKSEELASSGLSRESISNSVLRDNLAGTLEKTSGRNDDEIPLPEQTTVATVLPATVLKEPTINEDKNSNLVINKEEPKLVEAREMKKSSEKKSRTQKSSQVQPSSKLSRGTTKSSSSKVSKQSEFDETSNSEVKSETLVTSVAVVTALDHICGDTEKVDKLSSSLSIGELESVDVKVGPEVAVSAGNADAPGSMALKTWKAAANVKAKSLLDIQLEEQRRAKMEVAVSAITSPVCTTSLSAPWVGVVSNLDPKIPRLVAEGCNNTDANLGKSVSSIYNNCPGIDLSKANQKELVASDNISGIHGLHSLNSQLEVLDDDDFIDAKETKKSRKKGGKGKGAGNKSSSAISSIDVMISNSSVEKGKNSRQVQSEKEVLPPRPQGPSLSDFVPWKPELSSPSTAPAWSRDSKQVSKATSLRDILKEQEKGGSFQQLRTLLPTPQKVQVAPVNRVSSWSESDTSPARAASVTPTRILSSSEISKDKGEDDLFWGAPDLSRQESKLENVHQVGNNGSRGTKGTPAKVSSSGVALTRQNSAGGNVNVSSSSAAPVKSSSLEGKQSGGTKQSEAMDFRDWCERESMRLTGNKDTSFLEFCLKQPKSEAEILLVQNLGSLDTNHKFICKFLDYMEMLPTEVLDIAFQGPKDQDIASWGDGGQDMNSSMGNSGAGAEGAVGKGGKKKGKKGKKVSPSVLGISVVSNRIMMGEIQTMDD